MKTKLIFLHGGPGFRDYLRPYFYQLDGAFNCIFYDQGRGSNVSVEDLLCELESKIGDSMPVLVGHSWGGVLATEFASRHEKKISGLAFMSTGLSHIQWHDYRDHLEKFGLADAPMEKIVLAANDPPSAGVFLTDVDVSFSEETFDSLYDNYLTRFDLTEAVRHLSLKTVSIFGDRDLRFSPRIAQQIEALNPRIKSHQIAGAGHFPFLQKQARETIHQILLETFAHPCG
jgi:pimeloyl-ACP methyl ester carboxylesterase